MKAAYCEYLKTDKVLRNETNEKMSGDVHPVFDTPTNTEQNPADKDDDLEESADGAEILLECIVECETGLAEIVLGEPVNQFCVALHNVWLENGVFWPTFNPETIWAYTDSGAEFGSSLPLFLLPN